MPMTHVPEIGAEIGGAENAGVENAGVENTGATKYGKPSEEENTLKYETKYQLPCRPSSANQSSAS